MLAAVRRDWRLSLWNRMPGSQYRRGRDFEYATRDHLREHGYEVVRSAGSKTKIDLIGIKPGELLLVQCKLPDSAVSSSEWNKLVSLAAQIDCARPILAIKISGRAKPHYWHLTSPVMLRQIRRAGTHYETWRPDGARPSA